MDAIGNRRGTITAARSTSMEDRHRNWHNHNSGWFLIAVGGKTSTMVLFATFGLRTNFMSYQNVSLFLPFPFFDGAVHPRADFPLLCRRRAAAAAAGCLRAKPARWPWRQCHRV